MGATSVAQQALETMRSTMCAGFKNIEPHKYTTASNEARKVWDVVALRADRMTRRLINFVT